MSDTFLANIFRMKHIDRWSLMYNTRKENLSEHSFECALLTHHLAIIGNTYFGKQYDIVKLTCHALFHDVTEILTGDLPTPVKYYNQNISTAFKEMESEAAEKIIDYLPEEMRELYTGYFNSNALNESEKAIISAADKLCAYLKCIAELNAGNKEFSIAYKTIEAAIRKNSIAELEYFMQNSKKAFSLSLDELQGSL